MATLITGGAGFIGSRLAAQLIRQNEPIIILDNFDAYYDPSIKRAKIGAMGNVPTVVEGDLRSPELVERIFAEHDITRVAHMGGLAGVRSSIEQGPLYSDVNTTGSVNLMNIARKHKVSVFVQASTSSVYGQTSRIPFKEEDPPDLPLAAYPASKRAAELYGHSYHNLFGLNVTCLRFFNVYGPDGRPDMMPLKAIEAILNGTPIQLYDHGHLQRDWTYIDDIVDGVISALNRPMGYKIINMGYGSPIALLDFIHIYEELIGKNAITEPVPTPASEPRITYCDNSRARELLDFNPKVPIQEGLARTWEWYKNHKSL